MCLCYLEQLFHKTYVNFRSFVSKSESLPVDLHIVMSDILQEAGEDICLPVHVTYIAFYFKMC